MAISRPRTGRIDVRVSDEQHAMIREAAALSGQTVSAFLLGAAEERARELIEERRHLVLGDRAFRELAASLHAPAEPAPALTELFRLPRIDAA